MDTKVDARGNASEVSISSAGLQAGMDDIPNLAGIPGALVTSSAPPPSTRLTDFEADSANADFNDIESVSSTGLQCDPDFSPTMDVHAEGVDNVLRSHTPTDSGNEAGDSEDADSCSSGGLFAENFEPSNTSPTRNTRQASCTPPALSKRRTMPHSPVSENLSPILVQGPVEVKPTLVNRRHSPPRKRKKANITALKKDFPKKQHSFHGKVVLELTDSTLSPQPVVKHLRRPRQTPIKIEPGVNMKVEPGLSNNILDLTISPRPKRSKRKQPDEIDARHLAGEILELTDSDAPPRAPDLTARPDFFLEARTDMNGSSTLSNLNKMYQVIVFPAF